MCPSPISQLAQHGRLRRLLGGVGSTIGLTQQAAHPPVAAVALLADGGDAALCGARDSAALLLHADGVLQLWELRTADGRPGGAALLAQHPSDAQHTPDRTPLPTAGASLLAVTQWVGASGEPLAAVAAPGFPSADALRLFWRRGTHAAAPFVPDEIDAPAALSSLRGAALEHLALVPDASGGVTLWAAYRAADARLRLWRRDLGAPAAGAAAGGAWEAVGFDDEEEALRAEEEAALASPDDLPAVRPYVLSRLLRPAASRRATSTEPSPSWVARPPARPAPRASAAARRRRRRRRSGGCSRRSAERARRSVCRTGGGSDAGSAGGVGGRERLGLELLRLCSARKTEASELLALHPTAMTGAAPLALLTRARLSVLAPALPPLGGGAGCPRRRARAPRRPRRGGGDDARWRRRGGGRRAAPLTAAAWRAASAPAISQPRSCAPSRGRRGAAARRSRRPPPRARNAVTLLAAAAARRRPPMVRSPPRRRRRARGGRGGGGGRRRRGVRVGGAGALAGGGGGARRPTAAPSAAASSSASRRVRAAHRRASGPPSTVRRWAPPSCRLRVICSDGSPSRLRHRGSPPLETKRRRRGAAHSRRH